MIYCHFPLNRSYRRLWVFLIILIIIKNIYNRKIKGEIKMNIEYPKIPIGRAKDLTA